ncbi:hypothetical protein AD23_0993 [Escherichia coli 2-005-03_S4_C3]|nr:hypothetical protein AD23_0993 [Escherichia coli 2-005-03_S4_C3]
MASDVHCRTGSLEISAVIAGLHECVHCRTGSLQTQHSIL